MSRNYSNISKTFLSLLTTVFLLTPSAQATTVVGHFEVSAAVTDLSVQSQFAEHALYLPAFGTSFAFAPGASLTLYENGSGLLTATAVSLTSEDAGFEVSLNLIGITGQTPEAGPKLELMDHAYVDQGGTINPDTWLYFASFDGLLVGTGAHAGIELVLTQRGPAFQLGFGANGKNLEYGGSGWFTAMDQLGNTSTGDFNVNAATAVPLPAGFPLLLSVLVGLGLTSRGKK